MVKVGLIYEVSNVLQVSEVWSNNRSNFVEIELKSDWDCDWRPQKLDFMMSAEHNKFSFQIWQNNQLKWGKLANILKKCSDVLLQKSWWFWNDKNAEM
jgi:hypothetical protein